MKIIISTHSLIDVITNSSSELFICETDKTIAFIHELLNPIYEKDLKNGASGMGGEFEIKTIPDYFETTDKKRLAVYLADYLNTYDKKTFNKIGEYPITEAEALLNSDSSLFVIDIDWGMTNTILKIKETFNILNHEI